MAFGCALCAIENVSGKKFKKTGSLGVRVST